MKLTRIAKLRLRVFRDFVWPTELHPFAQFNVIYGWNGCGKTTLSWLLSLVEKKTALLEGEAALEIDGTTKVAGSAFASAQLPQVRVFNRDFISATLSQTGGITPIYFLGEDSIEKQTRVEQLKKELTTTDIALRTAQDEKTKAVQSVLPSENLHQQLEPRATGLFDAILGNVSESRSLAQLRDTLLPKRISGELRIKDAERITGVIT